MKLAIYGRTARECDIDTGAVAQIVHLKRLATDSGHTIEAMDAGRSGLAVSRPGYSNLLAALGSPGRNWDGLLIRDLSRLSRDLSDLARTLGLLHQHSCELFMEVFGMERSALAFALHWYSLGTGVAV
jgi:DNA invertase Pin-like site-specific DNA recombinase